MSGCSPVVWSEAAASANDDAVYGAVIDSTVRPELRRLHHVGSDQPEPPLVVEDESSGVDPYLRHFEDRSATWDHKLSFEGALPSSMRHALARSIRVRNQVRQPLGLRRTQGIVLVKPADFWPTLTRDWKNLGGYSHFSRPGYAGRHALVYATYTCGGLCGQGWLILLQREHSEWRVISAEPQWIS